MKLTDEQRERYGRMLVDSGAAGFVSWDRLSEARQHWYAEYATAVANAAVTDVLTRMIADAIGQDDDYSVVGYEGSYAVSHQSLEDYLRSHLPTPAPTADEEETDHA